jgi:hypothetical protein
MYAKSRIGAPKACLDSDMSCLITYKESIIHDSNYCTLNRDVSVTVSNQLRKPGIKS